MNDLPEATCVDCGHTVKCIRVADGTVYRPIAWTYPDDAKPLEGVCGGCQAPCEMCDAPGVLRVNGEVVTRVLCDDCYEEWSGDR